MVRVGGEGGVGGGLTSPVNAASAVMVPSAPTFTVASAIKFVPFGPGISTMPPPVVVAAVARRSGVGVEEAANSSVFTALNWGAALVLVPSKIKGTRLDASVVLGVIPMMKVSDPPGGRLIGVLRGALMGSRAAYEKSLGEMKPFGAIPTPVAVVEVSALMIRA